MRNIFLVVALLLFVGCNTKEIVHKKSWIILIKSPKLKFNDIGYILQNGDSVQLQLYSAGNSVESFSVDHLICTQSGCMRKSSFNAEFLNSSYDDDLLKDLLLRRPIFGGRNMEKSKEGFRQHIVSSTYDIIYKVDQKELYFKDRKNKILFKLKATGQ